MKRLIVTLWLLPLLSLFTLGASASVQAEGVSRESYKSDYRDSKKRSRGENQAVTQAAQVRYDKSSDHLSIKAEEASMMQVLSQIAKLSGIEVLFDAQAEETLTITIESDSLEEGMKQLLKGRNSMQRYSRDETGQLMLIGVMVLPAGVHDGRHAKRLVATDEEAYYRVKSALTNEQQRKVDRANERWQARVDEMPPERRQALERMINENVMARIQHDQRRARMKEINEKRSAERRAAAQAAKEKDLEALSPEHRESFVQRGEAARQQVKSQLQLDQQ